MSSRTIRGAALCGVALFCWSSAHAVTPPRDGGPLPESVRRVSKEDAGAYMPHHAWVQKSARAREARREFARHNGANALTTTSFGAQGVTGTMHVPVLPAYFSTQSSVPVSTTALQNNMFDSNPTGTIGQYYSEVSYGNFTVDGQVYPWTHLVQTNAYYAGTSNGLDPGDARTGELIKEVLDARDGTIDFGMYDNDGPDGVPNSGDDDGYVDLLCVLHGLPGAECGTGATAFNIAAHTWSYSAWSVSGGAPYVTSDAAFNGGFIKVDDYTVAPAVSCGGATTPIEIGVFCHEFGHGLGLPDLYDRDGSTSGIGYWGIMGAGAWNTPAKPSHPEAWTRVELGWVIPQDITWSPESVSIPAVEQNAAIFRLPFADERFRRMTDCAIGGAYSLYCGLTVAEGTARHYASPGPGGGYGPNWYETVRHDFHYDGTGDVTFQYAFKYDTEPGYDYGYALIEVNGVESQLVSYTGVGMGTNSYSLASYLAPLAGTGGDFSLKFRVITDYSFDDADGFEGSSCGALAVDNVSVSGGGINYATDFEAHIDGWYQDPAENPQTEYWLVENRRRLGSDINLPAEGLLIWHVDDETLHSPTLQNDGPAGTGGSAVRGLVLEEADNLFNLLMSPLNPSANKGDAGDPFPGAASNTNFGSLTSPASTDNTQRATRIEVTNIGAPGPSMAATLRAGNRGPVATAVQPFSIDNNLVAVSVEISGLRIDAGATISFALQAGAAAVAPGERRVTDSNDIVPVSVEWVDKDLVRAVLNVYSKTGGPWDLRVTNPDGQSYLLAGAITLNQIVATQLRSASIDVVGAAVRLRYELFERDADETLRLYRSTDPDGGWRVLANDLQPLRAESYEFVDAGVESGRTYYYLLQSEVAGGTPRELHRGSVTVPARDLALEQNVPNPFNPATSIRFFMPAQAEVTLTVYDVRGGVVRRLAGGTFGAGAHAVAWDGTDDAGRPVASGVYVYRLVSGSSVQTKKMMLVK